jgi:hypothetical protein
MIKIWHTKLAASKSSFSGTRKTSKYFFAMYIPLVNGYLFDLYEMVFIQGV